jgi:hypothetical protein
VGRELQGRHGLARRSEVGAGRRHDPGWSQSGPRRRRRAGRMGDGARPMNAGLTRGKFLAGAGLMAAGLAGYRSDERFQGTLKVLGIGTSEFDEIARGSARRPALHVRPGRRALPPPVRRRVRPLPRIPGPASRGHGHGAVGRRTNGEAPPRPSGAAARGRCPELLQHGFDRVQHRGDQEAARTGLVG